MVCRAQWRLPMDMAADGRFSGYLEVVDLIGRISAWMPQFIRVRQRSILLRLLLALLALVLPALLTLFLSWSLAIKSTGGGAAINMAGSLRKQAYQIAAAALAPPASVYGAQPLLADSIAEFEIRINHANIRNAIPPDPVHPVRIGFNRVEVAWHGEILPMLAKGAREQRNVLPEMHEFVGEIDLFVQALEAEHERKLAQLATLQWSAIIVMALVLGMLYGWLYRRVILPLNEMTRVARRVAVRDFQVSVAQRGEGEIGELADAMNSMVDEISHSYGVLEARVEEKTRELAHNQRTLALLYRIKQKLSDAPPSESTFAAVLEDVAELVPFAQASICVAEVGGRLSALKVASAGVNYTPHLCLERDCSGCLSARDQPQKITGSERIISLAEGGRDYGVMPIILQEGVELAGWQLELLENVGRHIATALAQVRRKEEQHRLALLEERSVIARELHDSLAQSLSYLKIQVLRLQALLPTDDPAAQAIVTELREGLNAAYRQLRELLTTFRLQMTERGLAEALEETIAEFSGRLGFAVELNNHLLGVELAAQEEIHVLQIVREALVNVESHAGASAASVLLDWRAPVIEVLIQDNGKGLSEHPERQNHYGLGIMRDRAQSLGGTLTLAPAIPQGTCVTLRFHPITPFGDTGNTP